jgi:hypothetical protein
MSFLRKLCVFALSLVALYLAALSLASFAVGAANAADLHDTMAALQGRLAGETQFSLQYRPVLLAAMVPIAMVAAFGRGWGVALSSLPTAAVGFWVMLQVPPNFPQVDTPQAATARLERTVSKTQKYAVEKFPDLARPGTPLHREFRERYINYVRLKPQYFEDPFWPMRLALESRSALRKRGAQLSPAFPLP